MREHPELRARMGEAAVRIARSANYINAGTMEFLVDRDRNFYFLEMNTRLQVEHPVTELVTGLDLVEWQLRIAAGERLTVKQEDVSWTGAAIECRIYAEDPANGFLPSPGKITSVKEPAGPGLRLDSGVYAGWTVPLDYDPLLAKLVAWGATREQAIGRMDRALAEYSLGGIRTNISFFRDILLASNFRAGRLSTTFLDEFSRASVSRETLGAEAEAAAAIMAALAEKKSDVVVGSAVGGWLAAGRERMLR
jgi:acetyl-CoA carboxylase biotin carboxylase subunit